MSSAAAFTHADLRILLRIIGSRKGANLTEIAAFHQSHRWPEATPDQIRQTVDRFAALGCVVEREGAFHATPGLQRAFNEACRNCRDTIEESDILARILAEHPGGLLS